MRSFEQHCIKSYYNGTYNSEVIGQHWLLENQLKLRFHHSVKFRGNTKPTPPPPQTLLLIPKGLNTPDGESKFIDNVIFRHHNSRSNVPSCQQFPQNIYSYLIYEIVSNSPKIRAMSEVTGVCYTAVRLSFHHLS